MKMLMPLFAPRLSRRSRQRRRLTMERLEGRALLAAATNPMALDFSVPDDLANRGVYVGVFGKLVSPYTPTSGPDAGNEIPAATIVYLQDAGGTYDFARPTASGNLPLLDLFSAPPYSGPQSAVLTIPPVDITSASVVFNVGATPMALPVDAGGTVTSPTAETNPNDVFGLFEWVYNSQEVDIDISQVDQAGLPFTAQLTAPFSASITQIEVPNVPGQGITLTTATNHHLQLGDTITISGVPSGGSPDLSFLNGSYILPVAPPSSTTFTLPLLPAVITPAHGTYTATGTVGGFQFTAPAQNGIGMFANRAMTFAGYTAFIKSLGATAQAFLATAPSNPLAPFPQNTRITAPFDVVGKLEQPPPTFIGGGAVPAQTIPGSSGLLTGTSYYKVTALGPTGEESMASASQVTSLPLPSNQSVAVSWNPYPYATGYHVYRSTTADSGYVRLSRAPIGVPTAVTRLSTAYSGGATLSVPATAAFPAGGGLLVTDTTTGASYTVSYTGKTATSFTGVAGPLPASLPSTTTSVALLPTFVDSGAAGTTATLPTNNYLYDPLNQYFDKSLQDFFDYYTNNDFVLVSTATSTTWRGRVQNLSLNGHTYPVLQLTGDAVGQVGAKYAGKTANIYLPFFADNTNKPSNPPAPYWLSPAIESPSSQVFGCDGAFSEPDNSQTHASAAADVHGLPVKSIASFPVPATGTLTCDWVEGTSSGSFTYAGTTVISGQAYLTGGTTGTAGVPAGATITLSNTNTGYENISTAPYLVVKDVMNPIATAFSRGLTPVKQPGGGFANVIAPSLWGTNPPWLIANPVSASSGSLTAGTYYYAISAVDVNGIAGETVISPIAQATVAPGQNAMNLLFQATNAPATGAIKSSTASTITADGSAAGFNYALWPGLNPTAAVNLSVTSGGVEQGYAYSSFGYPSEAVGFVKHSGGTGYAVNDILTIDGDFTIGGKYSPGSAPQLKVTGIGAGGEITTFETHASGNMLNPPGVATFPVGVTGGSGNGATFTFGYQHTSTDPVFVLPTLAEGTYPSSGTLTQIGNPTIGSYKIYRGTSPDSLALIHTVTNGSTPANSFLDTGTAGTTPPPFRFYAPGSTANFYSAYLHRQDVSTGGLAYGFAYDDQGGFSTNIDLKRTNPSLMAGTTAPLTVTIALPEWTQDIRSGDFNGDGLTDIAFRDAMGIWTAELTSSTAGDPPTSVTMATWSPSETWTDIVVGNFDGDPDGTDDIAGRDAAGTWYIIAKSGGTVTAPTFSNTPTRTWSTIQPWRDIVVGDFDGNGSDDIAGRAGSGGWVMLHQTGGVYRNSTMGTWTTSLTWSDVVVGDFLGTGVGIAGRANGVWFVMQYDTAASKYKNTRMGAWSPIPWFDVVAGDFNGDGRDDIAGRTATNAWWVHEYDGSVFKNTLMGRLGTTDSFSDVVVGDFVGDGVAGIAIRATSTGDWHVIQKSGGSYATTNFQGAWGTAAVWYATLPGRFDPTDTGPHKKTGLMGRNLDGTWTRSLSNGTTFTTTTPTGYPDLSS